METKKPIGYDGGTGAHGVSTFAVVAVLVLAVAAAGIAILFVSPPASSNSSCTSSIQSDAPTSALNVRVSEYSGSSNSANPPGYKPDSITLVIGVNSTVTWTNDDSAAHTVISTSAPSCGSFDSGNMNSGASYTHAFTAPGTYLYDCRYHTWMTGTIVVRAA